MGTGTHAGPNEIAVTVTVDQIKEGHFLLGRFNKNTGELTEVSVLDNKNNVPAATDLIRYQLIGGGEGVIEAMPLDVLVGAKIMDWDGASPVRLFFNRANGGYIRWAYLETGLGKTA